MKSQESYIDPRSTGTDLWLMLVRLLLTIPVAIALPFFFDMFGEPHPSGGLNAIGILLSMITNGVVWAGVFLVVGSIFHFCLRKRPWNQTFFADLILALVFILIAAIAANSFEFVDLEFNHLTPVASPRAS